MKTLTRALPLALLVGCSRPPPQTPPAADSVSQAGAAREGYVAVAAVPLPVAARPDAGSLAQPAELPQDADAGDRRPFFSEADAAAEAPERAAELVGRLEFETPYKLWHRPRPAGEVYAAERDEELARWNTGGNGDAGFVSSQPGYHPATRVRVDARALPRLMKQAPLDRRTGRRARVLSEQSLLAQARKQGYWPFRLCFEDGLRSDRKSKGETIVRASIGSTGRVSSARLIRTRLAGIKTADCLVERVRKLEFLPPPRRVDVELSIQLWPGDALLPSLGPPPGSEPESPGLLDVARLEPALESLRATAHACYSSALQKDPKLWGRIELRFELDPKGRLTRAVENESRFPERSVVSCLLDAARGLKLAAPKGGVLKFVWAVRLGEMPTPAPPPVAAAEDNNQLK